MAENFDEFTQVVVQPTDAESLAYQEASRPKRKRMRRDWVHGVMLTSMASNALIAKALQHRFGIKQRAADEDVARVSESLVMKPGRRRLLRHRVGGGFMTLVRDHLQDRETPVRDRVALLRACAEYWKLNELEPEELLEKPELEARFVQTLEAVFPKLSAENQVRVRAIVTVKS